jgi:hypothetical protein
LGRLRKRGRRYIGEFIEIGCSMQFERWLFGMRGGSPTLPRYN